MSWITLAVIALLLFGLSRILYIRASAQEAIPEDRFLRSLYLAGLLTMSPLVALEWNKFAVGNMYAGILLGLLSAVGSLALYRAVSVASPSIVNVIVGLNFVLPLVVGLALLKEHLTSLQFIGLALALTTIMISTLLDTVGQGHGYKCLSIRGVVYAFITFLTWGMLGIAVKVLYTAEILRSVAQSLWFMYLSGLAVIALLHRSSRSEPMSRLGLLAGILSSIGSYLVTLCYAIGEISVTALITRFSYLLPTVYSLVTSCEKMDRKKILVLVLSVASVVLLSI